MTNTQTNSHDYGPWLQVPGITDRDGTLEKRCRKCSAKAWKQIDNIEYAEGRACK